MGGRVRIILEGPDAALGRVPAADVVRLLQGYERALGRAAEARVRRHARTGRRGAAVESATRLILRSIEQGSLMAEVLVPDLHDEEGLAIDDAHLGEFAAADVVALVENPDRPGADERVTDALAQLGDDLGIGVRYPALVVEWQPANDKPSQRARFTADTRRRLIERRMMMPHRQKRDARVIGTLVEADFETHTAHVRTSDNVRFPATFGDEQADDIQAALRRPSQLEGEVEYDERTGAVQSVEVRSIRRPEQLRGLREREDFWNHRTVSELAAEQGLSAPPDLDELPIKGATDEELDAFLDALTS